MPGAIGRGGLPCGDHQDWHSSLAVGGLFVLEMGLQAVNVFYICQHIDVSLAYVAL